MTPEELRNKAEETRREWEAAGTLINVCKGTGCVSNGSLEVLDALDEAANGCGKPCKVRGTGCRGLCAAGPLVSLDPAGVMFQGVKPAQAGLIVASVGESPEAVAQGPAKEHLLDMGIPFFTRQYRVVLENAGKIDPERIEDYIAQGGYEALVDALTEKTPQDVLETITASGLRGRGGAGYPTGLKWGTVAKAQDPIKYVICNGDEGDPGAFMDRSVMEDDPHRILEGMTLAAYAVGATVGYIYVRAEYPQAIARLRKAIKQAQKEHFLGDKICGASLNFNIELRLGAGAFVCGEETALIASIEGGRGTPRPRPPYPAVQGLWGHPTLINNVETFSNIAPIVRKGAEWFAQVGTEKSKGTKVFALAGRVNHTGLVEVPMGIPLREIVFEIGGGIPEGKRCKAVQTGGPSGGCIPEDKLDQPVDYESLAALGSIMGSGGMIVMDETSNMVDVAKFFMDFCMTESCGKCVPCRVGTAQMNELLGKMVSGTAKRADLDLLEELCDVVKHTSLCGLGQSAPNPVLSTLHYFRHEYEATLVGDNGHAAMEDAS